MAAFLAGFFFLYSLLHAYVFVRARAALGLGYTFALLLALFMAVMISAPVVVRVLENVGLGLWARLLAFVGDTWMGLLFLFVIASIVVDVCRLALLVLGAVLHKDLSFFMLSPGPSFAVSVIAVAMVGVYGWFEARAIRTRKITVPTPKVSADGGPLRIVQISDVHLGLVVRQARLKRIVEQVRNASPDLLVSTGDLVDGQMNDADGVAVMLDGIRPRYGKFAVTGNHEFYAGLDQALAFTRRAGFHVLRGEAVTIPDAINLVGVDDPAGPGYGSSRKGEEALLSRVANGRFTLFLKHRPDVDPESTGLFDLQLSGHLHDGQIFPFRLITRLFFTYIAGFYNLPRGSALYVCRGSGTWGPPIRFLSPPEVTVIELVHGGPSPRGPKVLPSRN